MLGADTLVAVDGDDPRQAARRGPGGRLRRRGSPAARTRWWAGSRSRATARVVAEAVEVTEVVFRALEPAEVEAYVALGEWEGRAGGYAIQGAGAALVRSIAGDYLNVVGLPLARLLDLLPHGGLQQILTR